MKEARIQIPWWTITMQNSNAGVILSKSKLISRLKTSKTQRDHPSWWLQVFKRTLRLWSHCSKLIKASSWSVQKAVVKIWSSQTLSSRWSPRRSRSSIAMLRPRHKTLFRSLTRCAPRRALHKDVYSDRRSARGLSSIWKTSTCPAQTSTTPSSWFPSFFEGKSIFLWVKITLEMP